MGRFSEVYVGYSIIGIPEKEWSASSMCPPRLQYILLANVLFSPSKDLHNILEIQILKILFRAANDCSPPPAPPTHSLGGIDVEWVQTEYGRVATRGNIFSQGKRKNNTL